VIPSGKEANLANVDRARNGRITAGLSDASEATAVNRRPHPGSERDQISVAVCEEHEILSAGMVASLTLDRALAVTATAPEHLVGHDVDVAVVSSRAARDARFPCPIVIVSDEPEAPTSAVVVNDVAGVLHRGSLTVSQLRATVHAAAAGLRVQSQEGNGAHTPLDPRAVRVLELIADGCSTREIASLMNYSERTIKKLINELEDRLQTRTRAHTVAHAMRHGLI
jgi:DNA-binding NarL/FixJ family response regulator